MVETGEDSEETSRWRGVRLSTTQASLPLSPLSPSLPLSHVLTPSLVLPLRPHSQWLYEGEPSAFWLPGFFFPQGFLTAVLQNHARRHRTPIDRLAFSFAVQGSEAEAAGEHQQVKRGGTPPPPPESGVSITGLFLESARWDRASGCLREARPGEMTSRLPPVHFVPTELPPGAAGPSAKASSGEMGEDPLVYDCPLYKTSVRAGVLSTTGHSTNFVLHMQLPVAEGSSALSYVLAGVAALCALDGDEA